jgi:hypothetical protein
MPHREGLPTEGSSRRNTLRSLTRFSGHRDVARFRGVWLRESGHMDAGGVLLFVLDRGHHAEAL